MWGNMITYGSRCRALLRAGPASTLGGAAPRQLTERNRCVQRVTAAQLSRAGRLLGRRPRRQLHRRRHRALGRTPALLLRRSEVAPTVGRRAGDVRAGTLVCRAGTAHQQVSAGQRPAAISPTSRASVAAHGKCRLPPRRSGTAPPALRQPRQSPGFAFWRRAHPARARRSRAPTRVLKVPRHVALLQGHAAQDLQRPPQPLGGVLWQRHLGLRGHGAQVLEHARLQLSRIKVTHHGDLRDEGAPGAGG